MKRLVSYSSLALTFVIYFLYFHVNPVLYNFRHRRQIYRHRKLNVLIDVQSSCTAVQFLPAAAKLGQGNIFTSVCQEFCPQGGSPENPPPRPGRHHPPPGPGRHHPPPAREPPPGQADTTTPGTRQTPPPWNQGEPPRDQADPQQGEPPPPQDQADPPAGPGRPPPPRQGRRLQHTVNERPVRILLKCILVQIKVADYKM